ncbi:MAG: hypothetical protein V4655_07870 [Bdellovibrionota bacterium]|nr:MAG: hypothetical protein EOP10_17205 [Pseudomonadota bacterium]
MRKGSAFAFAICLGLQSFCVLSCKTTRPEAAQLSQVYDGKSIDALVLNEALVNTSAPCRFHTINFFNNAFLEGLIRNGAMQGLGTDNPAGPKIKGDSLYFQAIKVVSVADWEMLMALESGQGCLAESLSANFGVLPIPYANSLPIPFAEDVSKLKKAAAIINPALGDFTVRQINGMETPKAWPVASSLPPPYLAALLQGVKDKIAFAGRANRPDLDPETKAKIMAAAYTPYNISLNAQFPEGRPKASKFYLEAYLPPFYELETPNENDVTTWRLNPGLKKTPLPKEIDISVARLTHIGYMTDTDIPRQPVIKVQMYKDFANPNVLQNRFIFGRLDPAGTAKGAIPLNFKDHRDALYISFYPHLAIKDGDNAVVKGVKNQFNSFAGSIKVDARIHQLTLNLQRGKTDDTLASTYLKPKFSMKDSDISFRLHRYTKEQSEVKAMTAVGFRCERQGQLPELDCYHDFGAYTELADFVNKDFQGPANGNLKTKIADLFKNVVNDVVRLNVKFVIDWNIETIEKAIDEEFIQIFSDLIENQDKNNEKIRVRLEEALFKDAQG